MKSSARHGVFPSYALIWKLTTIACLAYMCVASNNPASAADDKLCITCEGPQARYYCVFAQDNSFKVARRQDRRLQLTCIRDIARRFNHASCSANAKHTAPCNGKPHLIDLTGEVASQAPTPPRTPVTDTPPTINDGTPKTVVELAKKTAKNAKQQANKTGRIIKKAAKKTWRCVASLFFNC